MSAEDVARALMSMEDVELRAAVAAGDVGRLGDLDLTEHELTLVRDAARGASDDVDGFGSVGAYAPPYVPVGPVVGGDNLMAAVRYAESMPATSSAREPFTAWTRRLGAQGFW
jgi:hypothetical protein